MYWYDYMMLILELLNMGTRDNNHNWLTPYNYEFRLQMNTDYYTQMSDNIYPSNWDTYYPTEVGATSFSSYNCWMADYLAHATQGRTNLVLISTSGLNAIDTTSIVKSVTISGTALRLLDLDPFKGITFNVNATNNTSTFTSSPIPVRLMSQTEYIYVQQCRNEMDSARSGQDVMFSDLLAVVPTFENTVRYDAFHPGSKLLMNGRSFDSFDLLFFDKWGVPLTGLLSFMMELSIEFMEADELLQGKTMHDVKTMVL
jgi:hypothetical protein